MVDEEYYNPDSEIIRSFVIKLTKQICCKLRKDVGVFIDIVPDEYTGLKIDGKIKITLIYDTNKRFIYETNNNVINDYLLDTFSVINDISDTVINKFKNAILHKYFKY